MRDARQTGSPGVGSVCGRHPEQARPQGQRGARGGQGLGEGEGSDTPVGSLKSSGTRQRGGCKTSPMSSMSLHQPLSQVHCTWWEIICLFQNCLKL